MATLEYFLVAESFAIDQGTNRVSLFHVLEDVQTPALPTVQFQMVAVSSWNVPPEEREQPLHLVLRIHPPNGAVPQEHPQVLEPANAPRRRSVVGFYGFVFDQPGDWRFEVRLGQQEAHHTITVTEVPAPQPQAPPP